MEMNNINPIHLRIDNDNSDKTFFYKLDVIDDWESELNRLINLQGDSLEEYLPFYSKAIKFYSNDKIIGCTYFFTVYCFILGVITNPNNDGGDKFNPGVNPFMAGFIVISIFTLLNMLIIKRNLFGSIVNDNSDYKVGYYELLDAQVKLLKTFQKESTKNSINRQYLWMGLLFIDFLVNIGFIFGNNILIDNSLKYQKIFQIGSLGYVIFYFCVFLNLAQAIMTIASAIHGSLSLMDLCDAWLERFNRYKRYTKSDFQQFLLEINIKRNSPVTIVTVQKDLFERYLLIVGILSKTSDIWSFSLACYIFTGLLSFFYFAYFAFKTQELLFYMYEFLILFYIFLMVSSVAYSNSAISSLKNSIKKSIPPGDDNEGNFSVLGGRKMWLEYLDEVPCYWTIYGFALTPQWLQGLFTGAVVTIVVSLIPVVASIAI